MDHTQTEFTILVMAIAGGTAEDHLVIDMVEQGIFIMDIMAVTMTTEMDLMKMDLDIMVVGIDMEDLVIIAVDMDT
ncbi:hypothetical protein TTRE_0000254301 [Trichuris trichiura]|uniref:Uncharacterized protein n=1 Tax=Trichuris trichiura TaxID=36087 RepID=A0A077Z3N4_TRITR|nr:hypothetical protein TTRE_0000254301 [Trichuris trichiura]